MSAPAEFVDALDHALTILAWQENLTSDEMPPMWMWHLDWELNDWFKIVKQKRDEKFGLDSSSQNDNDYEENDLFDEMKKDFTGG